MQKTITPDLTVGEREYFKRPVFADLYAVAGRFISIEAEDGQLAELFRHYFAGWHVTPVPGNNSIQPDVIIRVTADGDLPQPRADLESFEATEGGVCRTDASSYYFTRNESAVRAVSSEPPCIEVWVGNSAADRERAALARLIFNASMTALRRCGLFELHAAGVVSPTGTGVLIIGPSGSGKSTLATQLTSAGWRYLSDDSLLLYQKDEQIEAQALRRVFALSVETFSAGRIENLDALELETVPLDPLKKRFEPRAVFPDRFVESCRPASLVFSRLTREAGSSALSLSRSETMARLIRMCPWACYDKPAAPEHLNLLAALARQARGHELLAGTDLFGDAEYASNYLRSQLQ